LSYEASSIPAAEMTPERVEQFPADVLRERAGIDPGNVGQLTDRAAIGLVNGAWRTACVENWHVEGRTCDGDVLRVNSYANVARLWLYVNSLQIGRTRGIPWLASTDLEGLAGVAVGRALLGHEEFARAYQHGRAVPPEQTTTDALRTLLNAR
jgi:hypothetical protein